jgi:osmotically-inducible protein OsmY
MLSAGLTLIYSMMGVLNFAHASFYMVGAYIAYTLAKAVGFWPALFLAPLLVGGAVLGSGLVFTDRRTTGIQLEDQSIELRAAARVRELATLGRVTVTSYNRMVLITGEVPGAVEKLAVGQAVAMVENVKWAAGTVLLSLDTPVPPVPR